MRIAKVKGEQRLSRIVKIYQKIEIDGDYDYTQNER